MLRLPRSRPATAAPYDVPLLCANRYPGRVFYFVAMRKRGPIAGEGYPPGTDLSTWAILPTGSMVGPPQSFWELPR